jgi:transposase
MSSVASLPGLIHLGMDTSKNAIVVATLLPDEENPVTDRVANEEAAIRRLIGRFADRSVLRCWYEAGPGVMSCTGCWPRWGWGVRWWRRR